MNKGFAAAKLQYAIPMIPAPTSEAWLLCAWKNQPYQFCDSFEQLHTKNQIDELKTRMGEMFNNYYEPEKAYQRALQIDINKLQTKSFQSFRDQLSRMIQEVFRSSHTF